jgi:hypothetical protein
MMDVFSTRSFAEAALGESAAPAQVISPNLCFRSEAKIRAAFSLLGVARKKTTKEAP